MDTAHQQLTRMRIAKNLGKRSKSLQQSSAVLVAAMRVSALFSLNCANTKEVEHLCFMRAAINYLRSAGMPACGCASWLLCIG